MRDLVAPVLLLLGVGLDALPGLRLVLPELPLVVLPVDGPDDVVEVPGPAQRGDEARERRERGRRRDLSSTTASAHVSRTQASDAADVSSSTVSSSLLSTSTQPAPLSDMSFELRGKLLFRDGVESR